MPTSATTTSAGGWLLAAPRDTEPGGAAGQSVGASAGATVGKSVGASVGASVRPQVSAAASPDDEELMARVSATLDAASFDELVTRHERRARTLAFRVLGDWEESHDAAQEAFLRVWRGARRWKPTARFVTWFTRIVTNVALDMAAKKKPMPVAELPERPSEGPGVAQQAASREEVAHLMAAIGRLAPRARLALALVYDEGMRGADAAESMGLSLKAFESILVRARRELRAALGRPQKESGRSPVE